MDGSKSNGASSGRTSWTPMLGREPSNQLVRSGRVTCRNNSAPDRSQCSSRQSRPGRHAGARKAKPIDVGGPIVHRSRLERVRTYVVHHTLVGCSIFRSNPTRARQRVASVVVVVVKYIGLGANRRCPAGRDPHQAMNKEGRT